MHVLKRHLRLKHKNNKRVICLTWCLSLIFFLTPLAMLEVRAEDKEQHFYRLTDSKETQDLLLSFYQGRDYQWVWVEEGGLTELAGDLYARLLQAGSLFSVQLDAIDGYWMSLVNRPSPDWESLEALRLELLLTESFFLYSSAWIMEQYGTRHQTWYDIPRQVQNSLPYLLTTVIEKEDIGKGLAGYRGPEHALSFYGYAKAMQTVTVLERIYSARDYQPIWLDSDRLTYKGQELYSLLNRANEDLGSLDFHLEMIDGIWMNQQLRRPENRQPQQYLHMDVYLTEAFLLYCYDLARQRFGAVDIGWEDAPADMHDQLIEFLLITLEKESIEEALTAFKPYSRRLALHGLSHPLATGDLLRQVYLDRGIEPVWLTDQDFNILGWQLFLCILQAEEKGLNPADYHKYRIQDLWMKMGFGVPDPVDFLELELLLTEAFFFIASDLASGRLDPRTLERQLICPTIRNQLPPLLSAVETEGNVEWTLATLEPKHPYYRELQAYLKEGLRNDTLTPASKRELIVNLERWRWLPGNLGERYLLVNQPSFHLELWEEGTVVMDMETIVGKIENPTPDIRSTMTHMVFSPRWYMPTSIAVRDYLPRVKENPNYLTERNYRVYERANGRFLEVDPRSIDWEQQNRENFSYYFWQDPGPYNSLGRVIFWFPNPQDIYLHDTPERHLFEREQRAYSAGCIRIERPIELALYLLADQPEWDLRAINKLIDNRRETRVNILKPIPVYLTYFTALPHTEEGLTFYADIYSRNLPLYYALVGAGEDIGGERKP